MKGVSINFSLKYKKWIDAKTILKSKLFLVVKELREVLVIVLMFSKTKINGNVPFGNVLTDGFRKPYRLDRDLLRGGFLLYVREDIQSNLLTVKTKSIEGFYVAISLLNDNCFKEMFAQSSQ